jgi:hypothetical protein
MPVGLLVARRRGDSISLARAEDLRWDLYLGPWPSSFGYDATDEELARRLELDEMDVVELQPVVALGLDVLQLAPFSGSIPPALREANVVRAARGEVPLPTPVVGASDCCRQLQRLHALLGTHTYTDQDDQ